MKKAGIMTICGEFNYGNRLQNYAVQEVLKKFDLDVETIRYIGRNNNFVSQETEIQKNRLRKFKAFNENVRFTEESMHVDEPVKNEYSEKFDYIVMGSDQIWNYTFSSIFSDKVFASFVPEDRRISFSASFGIENIPEKDSEAYKICKENLKKIKSISVREDAGKKIIKELTNRDDVEVLIDPTMMLKKEEWEKVMKKPESLKTDKFIIKSFLGNTSDDSWKEICRIAEERNCEIIDISDENSPYFDMGPSEFLYLEKNAELVVTDSFHSCVFAILFSTPFVVFKREDNRVANMYSRIETLLKTFELEDRIFNGSINENIFNENYENAYKILETKRQNVMNFLNKSLV